MWTESRVSSHQRLWRLYITGASFPLSGSLIKNLQNSPWLALMTQTASGHLPVTLSRTEGTGELGMINNYQVFRSLFTNISILLLQPNQDSCKYITSLGVMGQVVMVTFSGWKQLPQLWNTSHLSIEAEVKFPLCLEIQTLAMEQLQKMLLGGMTD